MKYLDISNQNLKELPELPAGLEELYCRGNQLTELKDLPAGLKRLWCRGNPFPPKEKERIIKYCEDNNIYLSI